MSETQLTQDAVHEASLCISEYHPLGTFIHSNALQGLENMPFETAMEWAKKLYGGRTYLPLSEYESMLSSGRIIDADLAEARGRVREIVLQSDGMPVSVPTVAEVLDKRLKLTLIDALNRQMIKWLGAYLDGTQAQWSMERGDTLFQSWRRMAEFDNSLSINGAREWREHLRALPDNSAVALRDLLMELGIADDTVVPYLRQHLVQLPGWTSHLKYRAQHAQPDILTDYLAMRLFYELHLSKPAMKRVVRSEDVKPFVALNQTATDDELRVEPLNDAVVWQEAYEINYRNRLLNTLRRPRFNEPDPATAPQAQLVFCMDVRSEPVRRLLDADGKYDTYGFAGFFGFPIKFSELGSAHSVDLCPVLLKPEKHVREISQDRRANRLTNLQAIFAAAVHLQKRLKSNLAGAFGLVETFGPWSTFPLLGRTFFPRQFQSACDRTQKLIGGDPGTELDTSAFSVDEKASLAAAKLRAIGLTQNFAPVVVLCGHRSLSSNNPYASALDCGACGGQPGGTSAKLACTVFNDPEVRAKLRESDIDIPDTTLFVAGEHTTTTDTFELMYCQTHISSEHQQLLAQIKSDLAAVGSRVRSSRMAELPPSAAGLNAPSDRAHDWAQIMPEWGLSRNACFIAGPRNLTRGVDLEARAFLQSYDCAQDPDGEVLKAIMTAPMVVAQWISAEFYLSTVDNVVYGSGSKTTHNVIGDFGVMQGASGDLQIGLPRQSVMYSETARHHEPMRLVSVIRAPVESIDRVLGQHDKLADLVKNRWIRLIALDPVTGQFLQADGLGQWRKLD